MIVSVVTPSNKVDGNTVASILLSLGLGDLNKNVILSSTKPLTPEFFEYTTVSEIEDKTSTPTQLVKLLREGAIKLSEISDYCKSIGDGVHMFANLQTNFTETDMSSFVEFLLQVSEFDFIVFDVQDMVSDISKMVLKESDMIIFNIDQNYSALADFKDSFKQLQVICKDKKIRLLCNKFNKGICNIKDVVKRLGIDAKCSTLHYNHSIQWACNRGKLDYIYERFIRSKNWEVCELYADINSLATVVSKANIVNLRQRQQTQKEINLKLKEKHDKENAEKAEKTEKTEKAEKTGGVE